MNGFYIYCSYWIGEPLDYHLTIPSGDVGSGIAPKYVPGNIADYEPGRTPSSIFEREKQLVNNIIILIIFIIIIIKINEQLFIFFGNLWKMFSLVANEKLLTHSKQISIYPFLLYLYSFNVLLFLNVILTFYNYYCYYSGYCASIWNFITMWWWRCNCFFANITSYYYYYLLFFYCFLPSCKLVLQWYIQLYWFNICWSACKYSSYFQFS